MFDAHVPARYRDRAPRVVEEPDGSQQWYYGEHPGPEPRAERGRGQAARDVQRRPDALRATCGPVATTCTSGCATCRPAASSPGSTSRTGPASPARCSTQGPDRDVNLVMIKAYNDWHVDEWCGAYPERFIPCGILPLFDVRRGRGRSAPARGQGLPRGHVLREPGRPRDAEHPLRRVGSAVRRVLRRRAPCCAATSARRRSRRRPSPDAPRAGADEPLVGDGDLHARRPAVGRLLAPLPDAALRAHRRRHRVDPVLPAAGRAHARPAQRLDAPRARRRACRRASCSASASCAASSTIASA